MILFEVKTYVAVCGWCRKESEPFTSRRDWGKAVPEGWGIVHQGWTRDYGMSSDTECVCPDCTPEALAANGWKLTTL